MEFTEISQEKQLDAVFEESERRPILIFKHSPHCSISHFAKSQFSTFLKSAPDSLSYYQIDVIHARHLSRSVAEQTGVVHESPQSLLLYKRKCIWNDSHGALTVYNFQQHTNQKF